MSKFSDDWKRIHNFLFSKNLSMHDFISIDWKTLKYIIFDLIIDVLLKQNRETILFKKKIRWRF